MILTIISVVCFLEKHFKIVTISLLKNFYPTCSDYSNDISI